MSLAGRTIVVTRARTQASTLVRRLAALGADTIEIPMIEIVDPPDDGAALRRAVAEIDRYEWVALTSTNAAERFLDTMAATPPPLRIAAIGPATAAVIEQRGLRVDLIPERAVGEALVEVFPAPTVDGAAVLFPAAETVRPTVVDGLMAKGWIVDHVVAYRTVDATITDDQRRRAADAEIITFTASSTVERFCRLVGIDALPPIVACIGPITAGAAREHGLVVDIEATDHSIAGLVAALSEAIE